MLHITQPFHVFSDKYKDLLTSIYPFNKPEEGWCWPPPGGGYSHKVWVGVCREGSLWAAALT